MKHVRQRLLNKQVGSFLICLALAATFWLIHALNRNYKYTLSIPVKFINLPSNKVIVGELPDQLEVTIKASGLKLLFISFQSVSTELCIDFNTLKTNAKSQAYAISNGNFNLKNTIHFDVEVIKIRPDTLFFSLNKGKSKMVPIKAILQAECLPGYAIVSKPALIPSYVSVTGDSTEVNAIDTVYTSSTTLKGIHQNYKSIISLKKTASNINYQPNNVELSFEVDRLVETSVKVPITIMNQETNHAIRLLPSFVTVTYLVSMRDYDNINASSFKAMVNYHQIKQQKKMLDVMLTVTPSGINIIKTEPNTVSYLIYN